MYENGFLLELVRSREDISLFCINGFNIKGYISEYDTDTVFVIDSKKQKHMVYKHAISTIVRNPVQKTPTSKIPY